MSALYVLTALGWISLSVLLLVMVSGTAWRASLAGWATVGVKLALWLIGSGELLWWLGYHDASRICLICAWIFVTPLAWLRTTQILSYRRAARARHRADA